MDQTLSQLLKSFTHFARELFVYCLSGSIIILNLCFLDYYFDHSRPIWTATSDNTLFFPAIIIVSYVLGQLCLAFYYVLMERTPLEGWLDRWFQAKGVESDKATANEPAMFARNEGVYLHFIERPNLLILMRWNLSAAFLLMALTNAFCAYRSGSDSNLLWSTSIGYAAAAGLFYLLMLATEKERADRLLRDCVNVGSSSTSPAVPPPEDPSPANPPAAPALPPPP